MKRLVLLQIPIEQVERVFVTPGAPTIERATGLRPDQIARLFFDDRDAILLAMGQAPAVTA